MAVYHLSAMPVKRSAGRSVVAAAAYRSATELYDELTGQTHDYQRKRGVIEAAIIAPDDAPEWVHDRAQLWNEVEATEKRVDAQLAREVRLALPYELTDEQRADLVFNFCRDVFVNDGMIADVSIHRPDRHGDQRNHHAHVLLTMRPLDGDSFAATKERAWNRKDTLQTWREKWEDYQNDALEAAGHDSRVDHRSYQEMGVDQEGTIHLGPKQSGMERKGKQTPAGDHNRHVQDYNRRLAELAAVDSAIVQEETRLSSPATSPQDALARLQQDKQLYETGLQIAARLEKALPADRMGWGERMLLYVARTAKGMFDSIAEKAYQLAGLRDPERRKRQQPTTNDRRWQNEQHARRQAEKNRGLEI
jgi:ATP-dependent exoDNAse (exonuclease V) alpha subunit